MNHFIDKIIHPERKQLINFSIFVLPIIIGGLYEISFVWYIGIESILELIYFILFLFLIATWNNDRVYKTKLTSYVVLTLILLTFFAVISYPTRDFLITKSQEQGSKIALKVQEYKKLNENYPSSLDDKFFKDLNLRSFVGTKFFIETYINTVENETNCYIKYISFGGYIGSYNVQTKKWRYLD